MRRSDVTEADRDCDVPNAFSWSYACANAVGLALDIVTAWRVCAVEEVHRPVVL